MVNYKIIIIINTVEMLCFIGRLQGVNILSNIVSQQCLDMNVDSY